MRIDFILNKLLKYFWKTKYPRKIVISINGEYVFVGGTRSDCMSWIATNYSNAFPVPGRPDDWFDPIKNISLRINQIDFS